MLRGLRGTLVAQGLATDEAIETLGQELDVVRTETVHPHRFRHARVREDRPADQKLALAQTPAEWRQQQRAFRWPPDPQDRAW